MKTEAEIQERLDQVERSIAAYKEEGANTDGLEYEKMVLKRSLNAIITPYVDAEKFFRDRVGITRSKTEASILKWILGKGPQVIVVPGERKRK